MSYTHFETVSTNYSDIVPEEKGCDCIFSDTIGVHGPVSDHAYDKPDRKQFIFTNINSIGISAMYGNNLVTPARFRPSLLGYKTAELVSKLTGSKTKDTLGVFIVEYISIHHYQDTTRYMNTIRNYYQDVVSMMPNRDQAMIIENALAETTAKGNSRTIRTITFIPQKELFEKQYVYEPMSSILICVGQIGHDVIHPNSVDYKGLKCDIHNINKNSIAIDIIDNNISGPYYTKVGKKIIPVIPTKDLTKPNGVTITSYVNGAAIDYYNASLEEAPDVLGVYRTELECKIEGDMNNQHIKEKLRLEEEKLKVEQNKINLEYIKIAEEKNKLEIERNFYKFKVESDMYKIQLELNINKNKYKAAGIEYKKKLYEESTYAYKYNADISSYNMKLNLEHNKHLMDKEKHNMDMLSKGISLATTLGKLF